MPLSSGTTLGPYTVGALIGQGGMGEVYQARDTKLDRDAALKVLPEAFTAESANKIGSSHKCVHDSAPAGRPRRGKRVRMRSCQLTSGEVVCRSVDGRLRGPRF